MPRPASTDTNDHENDNDSSGGNGFGFPTAPGWLVAELAKRYVYLQQQLTGEKVKLPVLLRYAQEQQSHNDDTSTRDDVRVIDTDSGTDTDRAYDDILDDPRERIAKNISAYLNIPVTVDKCN